ncbi:hypothetical protein J3R30DRAFT_1615120 [Lentinula aciculospora]|uniref:Uncharacterized protein n=1 Tax=Lentinula aciculospora TaxID=153920 RepID=A0A9W9DG73_9AGAR|nr:hypothetical protein J3R30DRAFT_1615120 [Lentinula aciculospora]
MGFTKIQRSFCRSHILYASWCIPVVQIYMHNNQLFRFCVRVYNVTSSIEEKNHSENVHRARYGTSWLWIQVKQVQRYVKMLWNNQYRKQEKQRGKRSLENVTEVDYERDAWSMPPKKDFIDFRFSLEIFLIPKVFLERIVVKLAESRSSALRFSLMVAAPCASCLDAEEVEVNSVQAGGADSPNAPVLERRCADGTIDARAIARGDGMNESSKAFGTEGAFNVKGAGRRLVRLFCAIEPVAAARPVIVLNVEVGDIGIRNEPGPLEGLGGPE